MRYVLLSSSRVWKKGDRIVVKQDDNEYYLATIYRKGSKKYYYTFDDGDTGDASLDSKRIIGEGINRKVKKPFTKKEAVKYLKSFDNANPPSIRKPRRHAINNKQDAEIPSMSSYPDKLKYTEKLWEFFNKKYFSNRLEKPKFSIAKDIKGNNIRNLANYRVRVGYSNNGDIVELHDGEIRVSPFILRDENQFRDVFLHEMCHQATYELDKVKDVHGPYWKAWAKKCGISDKRLYDASSLLTEEERKEREKIKEESRKLREQLSEGGKNIPITNPKIGDDCKFSYKDTWYHARIVYVTTRYYFAVCVYNGSFTYFRISKIITFRDEQPNNIPDSVVNAYNEFLTTINKKESNKLVKEIRNNIARETLKERLSFIKNSTNRQISLGDGCVTKSYNNYGRLVKDDPTDAAIVEFDPKSKTYALLYLPKNELLFLDENSKLLVPIPKSLAGYWIAYLKNVEDYGEFSPEAIKAYQEAVSYGNNLHHIPMSDAQSSRILSKLMHTKVDTPKVGMNVRVLKNGEIKEGRIGFADRNSCAVVYIDGHKLDCDSYSPNRIFSSSLNNNTSNYIPDNLVALMNKYYSSMKSKMSNEEIEKNFSMFKEALKKASDQL